MITEQMIPMIIVPTTFLFVLLIILVAKAPKAGAWVVGGLVLLAERAFRLPRPSAVVSAVLVAAALFAGAHTLDDPRSFTWPTFLFHTAAGIYLSAVFAMRGFGLAAGTHIVFNLIVKLAIASG